MKAYLNKAYLQKVLAQIMLDLDSDPYIKIGCYYGMLLFHHSVSEDSEESLARFSKEVADIIIRNGCLKDSKVNKGEAKRILPRRPLLQYSHAQRRQLEEDERN